MYIYMYMYIHFSRVKVYGIDAQSQCTILSMLVPSACWPPLAFYSDCC